MMVNSNVPRYSNLASELHRNYLFKFQLFKFVLSSVRSNMHMMDPLCEQPDYKLVSVFNSRSYMVKIVQLQSALNDDYNNVEEKIVWNMYHMLSEPIIRRFFSWTCATLFTFEQFSLIHSALQWNAATLRRFWRLFRSVMWSILVPFIPFLFLIFFPFFLDFFLIVVISF